MKNKFDNLKLSVIFAAPLCELQGHRAKSLITKTKNIREK